MPVPSYILIGLLKFIEIPTIYLLVTEYYLIMSPKEEVEHLLQKKITKTVSDIHKGIKDILILGNLDASRDWGHAKDYVVAM